MRTREEAVRAGKALLKMMVGRGWKLCVHENLGWWYSVYNGNLTVSPGTMHHGKTVYFCLLSDDRFHGTGLGIWTNDYYSVDPNKVVRHQIKFARKIIDNYEAVVREAEEAVGIRPARPKKRQCLQV